MLFNRYHPDALTVEFRIVIACGTHPRIRLVRHVTHAAAPLTIDLDRDDVVDLTHLHRTRPSAQPN